MTQRGCSVTIVAFFDVAFLATLPGRTIEPAVMDRRGTVRSGPLTLCGRLSNPLIEVDAVVHEDCPDAVCDVGYGIAPGTVIDGGGPCLYPTTAWFEAFSEEGCATGIACTPASHMPDRRKE